MEGATRARGGKWANGQMAQLYGVVSPTGRRHLAHMKAFIVRVHPKLLVHEYREYLASELNWTSIEVGPDIFNLPWISRKHNIKTGLGTTDMG